MYTSLPQLPLDPIFKIFGEYLADKNPKKVNLGIGLYADDQGKPYVFPSVQKAFGKIDHSNFDYPPIGGNKKFLEETFALIFEKSVPTELVAKQATCGGTQAIRLFADLFASGIAEQPSLLYGSPTWGNHLAICKDYNQISFEHRVEDHTAASIANYLSAISTAPANTVLLLHGGLTHNPTGLNIVESDLDQLINAANAKNITVLVDSAYLGFGDEIKSEIAYLQKLLSGLNNVAIAISFSKNASLYEHRTGILYVKAPDPTSATAIESQLQQLSRESISMAPGIGQELMTLVYEHHLQEWLSELNGLRLKLDQKRNNLITAVPSLYYLAACRGMFGILQFSPEQIQKLKTEYSIYLSGNGRVNIAGINQNNLDYLADCLKRI